MTAGHEAATTTRVAPAARQPGARGLPGWVISGLVLLALAIVLLGLSLAVSDRPTVAVVWGALALGCYAAALLCLAGVRVGASIKRWKLGPLILLSYGIVYGITTLSWSRPQAGVAAEIAVSSVLKALWLVAVGLTAWGIGYLVGPSRLVARLGARAMGKLGGLFSAEVRSRSAPWVLYGVGIAARLASAVTTGRFGYVGDAASAVTTATSYQGILGAVTLCAPLGLAAAAMQVFRERVPGARVTLAVLLLVELAFGAAAGGKGSFIIAVLAVAIPFSAARRKLPRAALVAVAFVFLVIVIPFNQAYRAQARSGTTTLTTSQAVGAAPSILRQTLSGHSMLTVVPQSVGYLMQRLREIDSPAMIMQRTPDQVGFVSPLQLAEGPIVDMVPRALWPGKPILVTGYLFSQQFFGLPSGTYTATADTMIGGMYWHGGWIPLLAGMFVFGSCVRLLDEILDVYANPHATFVVLLLFSSLVTGEEDWQAITSAIPATIFVWLFAVVITFRVRRRG